MAPMQGYNTIAPPGFDATASSVSVTHTLADLRQEASFWGLQ